MWRRSLFWNTHKNLLSRVKFSFFMFISFSQWRRRKWNFTVFFNVRKYKDDKSISFTVILSAGFKLSFSLLFYFIFLFFFLHSLLVPRHSLVILLFYIYFFLFCKTENILLWLRTKERRKFYDQIRLWFFFPFLL